MIERGICDDCGRIPVAANHVPPGGAFELLVAASRVVLSEVVCPTCRQVRYRSFTMGEGRVQIRDARRPL